MLRDLAQVAKAVRTPSPSCCHRNRMHPGVATVTRDAANRTVFLGQAAEKMGDILFTGQLDAL